MFRSGELRRIQRAAALILLGTAVPAQAQVRIEVIPLESVALAPQQVLRGETAGKPVTVAGELRLPAAGNEKLPAVVLVHGANGLLMGHDEWARALNGWGIAAFMLDNLSGRGIAPFTPAAPGLSVLTRLADVYRALALLAKHPRIDPDRIAVMGTSLGATAAMLASTERFRRLYGPPDVQFVAFVGLYPNCTTRYREDAQVAARPIRLFHGAGDDYVPLEACRALVADMKKAGADVTLSEFLGATHSYDEPSYKERRRYPDFVSMRNCSLVEGEGGKVVSAKTGKPDEMTDSCREWGVTMQYDEAATAATRKAVKDLLASVFAASRPAGTPAAKALEFGTAAEAKAMLERAVAALQVNKADALAKFQKGEGGFRDRDLYVFCAGPDGSFSAHPALLGQPLAGWADRSGRPLGQEIIQAAQEGKFAEVAYDWPRPGQREPVPKVTYVTKVGDQVCGVGYYK